MVAIYSQSGLRQNAPAPKPMPVKTEKAESAPRPPRDMRLKVTDATLETIRQMWGKPLAEIAKATNLSPNYVSLTAKRIGLPSRKRAPRHVGILHSERDDRLREVWARPGMTMQERAEFAGFAKHSGARRRAKQLNLGEPGKGTPDGLEIARKRDEGELAA